ncbi:aldehyde dehydrogenase family protein [Clostridioides difficile]
MISEKEILNDQKEYFAKDNTLSFQFRLEKLKKLKKNIIAYEDELKVALYKDLGKSEIESYASEIGFVLASITHTIRNLKKWMKPEKKKMPITLFPSKSMIIKEPYGVVYIIGQYNYPFQLLIEQLIGEIAAGNCAVLSPSKLAPSVSELTKKIIKDTFEYDYILVLMVGLRITQFYKMQDLIVYFLLEM